MVERWTENCTLFREPSRLALGSYIREHWIRELERQNAIKQSKPDIAGKRQPPGPELLEESRFRCYEGPIGFGLDVISQWHRELAFVLRFLHAMNSAPVYHSFEFGNAVGAVDTSRVPTPTAEEKGGGGRAAWAPARAATEGTSSAQPPRAQQKRAADPPTPIRREERPTAGDSHYAPRAARSISSARATCRCTIALSVVSACQRSSNRRAHRRMGKPSRRSC